MTTVIYETVFGSHLYGTATPTSDFDYKTIFIPGGRSILLGNYQEGVFEKTRTEGRNTADDEDREYYSIKRFFKLLSEGQINCLEILFSTNPDNDLHPVWREIYDEREKFFSKKSKAFIGYCRGQANNYNLKGERVASAEAALAWLRARSILFGSQSKLYEIGVEVFEAEHCEIQNLPINRDKMLKHWSVCGRKMPFTITVKEALPILERLCSEYGQRTRGTISKKGIDWKAISHAVRIGEESIEFLTEQVITLPRPNRQWLLEIRNGEAKESFDEIGEYIQQLIDQVEYEASVSTLPDNPDTNFMEDFLAEKHLEEVLKYSEYRA